MTTDEHLISGPDAEAARRLEPYLDTRAGRIPTGSPDLDRVVARATARRRRRRTATAVAATVVLALGAVGAAQVTRDAGTVIDLASPPPAGAPQGTPLAWHTVTPRSGLTHARSSVSLDGARFALSTAPGSTIGAYPGSTLYRSTDGIEWSALALPRDFSATAMSGADERVYAVGTSPAGGSRAVSVVEATAAGDTSEARTIPLDVGALERQAGAPVVLHTSVAVGHGRVVVAATAAINVWSLRDRLPGVDLTHQAYVTEEGIVSVAPTVADGAELGPAGVPSSIAGADAAVPETTVPPAAPATVPPGSLPIASGTGSSDPAVKTVTTLHRWDELGLPETVRQLLLGTTHLFASTPEGDFEAISGPAGVIARATVVSVADGFRLVVSTRAAAPTARVFASSDLATWQERASFASFTPTVGVVGGRAVVVSDAAGPRVLPVVHTERADGTWSSLELSSYLDTRGGGGGEVAIGPLGVAVLWWDGEGHSRLVHSADGLAATVTEIPAEVDGTPVRPESVLVGADAVVVSLVARAQDPTPSGDRPPAPVRLFVGVRG